MTARKGAAETTFSELAADPNMLEPVEKFLGELPGSTVAIEETLASRDIADLARPAHQIEGATDVSGFPDITELVTGLEPPVASAGDLAELKRPVDALSALYGRSRASGAGT